MGQHSEAELNQKFIETAKLMNIYLNHFPKFEKYAMAQQIRQCMYEVYALIVEAQKRFIRKHSIFKFHRAALKNKLESVVSTFGHARYTHSLKHLINTIKENHNDLYRQLPKIYRF